MFVFPKFCYLIFLMTVRKKKYWHAWLPIPMSWKMTSQLARLTSHPNELKDDISTDPIGRFLKVQYLKSELRNKVYFLYISNKSIQVSLAWLDIPNVFQNNKSTIYSKNRCDLVFFVYSMSALHSFGWSVRFHEVAVSLSHIILTS